VKITRALQTALAAARLIRRAGAEVTAVFIVDLPELGGGARLREEGMKVHSLVEFEGH
jgi:adenine phosphoribosyltransferase